MPKKNQRESAFAAKIESKILYKFVYYSLFAFWKWFGTIWRNWLNVLTTSVVILIDFEFGWTYCKENQFFIEKLNGVSLELWNICQTTKPKSAHSPVNYAWLIWKYVVIIKHQLRARRSRFKIYIFNSLCAFF